MESVPRFFDVEATLRGRLWPMMRGFAGGHTGPPLRSRQLFYVCPFQEATSRRFSMVTATTEEKPEAALRTILARQIMVVSLLPVISAGIANIISTTVSSLRGDST